MNRQDSAGITQSHSATHGHRMVLPVEGKAWDELEELMSDARSHDARRREGRMFMSCNLAGEDVAEVAQRAYLMFFFENAFLPGAYPSIAKFETEVVAMTASLLRGDEAVGTVTTGGTEGIFLAMKAARDQARHERGVKTPEIVVPRTAYPAFVKAAHYLGFRIVRTTVDSDFKADLSALESAITKNTVLIAGSAPGLSHGVVDPIAEMAAIAAARGINFHVDAGLGGYQLAFLRKLGYPVTDYDFSVPGVTSITADLHKYAYTALGASTILYRNPDLHKYQAWELTDWAMGTHRSRNMLGTHAGGAVASAWAVMQYLGEDGYLRLTKSLRETTHRFIDGINSIPELQVWGKPEMSVFAFGSPTRDIFAIGQLMTERGWYIGRQQMEPPSIHLNVTPVHERVVDEYLGDLRECVKLVATGQPHRR